MAFETIPDTHESRRLPCCPSRGSAVVGCGGGGV